MASSEKVYLIWNDFASSIVNTLCHLKEDNEFRLDCCVLTSKQRRTRWSWPAGLQLHFLLESVKGLQTQPSSDLLEGIRFKNL